MFNVGQPVRCVNGTWGAATGTQLQKLTCPHLPIEGLIYTVRWVGQVLVHQGQPIQWFVRLIEVVNPLNCNGTEPIFYACNFVPLCEYTASIDLLHEIRCNPQKRIVYKSSDERRFDRKRKKERAQR